MKEINLLPAALLQMPSVQELQVSKKREIFCFIDLHHVNRSHKTYKSYHYKFCEMPFPHASMEQFTNGHLKILKVIFEKNLQNHYFTFMTLVKKNTY